MKHALLMLAITSLLASDLLAQKTMFVESREIPISVILPKRADPLINPRWKKSTNVIFQKDGEDIGIYGKLELLSKGEVESVYTCKDIRFGLLNSMYQMCGQTLCTIKKQRVEALMVDISTEYDCQKLIFNKDSLAKDVFPQKKLVMYLDSVNWSHTSYSVSPTVEVGVIDSIDKDGGGFYTLAVKSEDDKVCGMFQLDRDMSVGGVTREMVYKIPAKENSKFSDGENGQHLLNGKSVTSFIILKDTEPRRKVKVKKSKHKKETRK